MGKAQVLNKPMSITWKCSVCGRMSENYREQYRCEDVFCDGPVVSVLPAGYEAVRFPVTIEVSFEGRLLFGLPVPYDPVSQEGWRAAVTEAFANLNKKTQGL